MGRLKDYELMHQRYKLMWEYQQSIAPFTPTMEELVAVWRVKSKEVVSLTLENLVQEGLVTSRKRGKHTQYAALPKEN